MRIDPDIKPVVVEIDDKEYAVAAKTVDIAEKLQKAEETAVKTAKPQFELWLQHLEILLGRAAVRELFPGGKNENLDRMEAIYYGVLDAFNYNGREARSARAEDTVTEAKAIAEALKPLGDLMALLGGAGDGKFPAIRRPK
ncbi:MAG: hypothetical protein VB115_13955 [Christensenellaceae bacterium]|nr:hypothetical protein [Christensenellaceae bacterium]